MAPSQELVTDFAAALSRRIRGSLHTDQITRSLYATDASMYQVMPVGVLFPKDTDDVQAALEVARRFSIAVLPRGGGSSLAGQTVNAALVLDFTRHMHRILEVNAEQRWARVQPGVILDDLNAAVADGGLTVGPDPASASRATLGGMVANNSTGTHSILYGNMIRHTCAIEALLDDGTPVRMESLSGEEWNDRSRRSGREGRLYQAVGRLVKNNAEVIRRDTPSHWRRNSGYRLEALLDEERNLAHVLSGSEGTLGVMTEITVDLVDRPAQTALGIVHFGSRDEALRAVTTILETKPSAVELFDGVVIESARKSKGFAHRLTFLEGDPGSALMVEYFGEPRSDLSDKLDRLDKTGAGYATVRPRDQGEIQNAWTVRKEGLGLIMGAKGDFKPWGFIEDASVPVEHLADYVEELDSIITETDTKAVYYAHASAGCLHIRPFINTKDLVEVEKMKELAGASARLVRERGGSVSSEHGDGIARSWLNRDLLGEDLYAVNRQLKNIFDPDNRLNPGRKVNAPGMDEHLRMGPDYHTRPMAVEMDWSDEGDFAQAVELCNGNGACRKLRSGTMCPSYMVTLDEKHSTRGRANALRNALSGELPEEALAGDEMYEVMDLCIQCKGCKTECPSSVDMARIKTEWLSTYWKSNKPPWRTRFFAKMPQIMRRVAGTPLAGMANALNANRAQRFVMEKAFGVARGRSLPVLAREPFTEWFKQQDWRSDGPPVVLFADTFNNYTHPETAKAAAQFFHRLGYAVKAPDASACCGRPYLSKGFISEAQILALKAVETLYPYAEEGMPIVGLEPSCILTFTDELLSLLPGEPRAEQVAQSVYTFASFVAGEAEDGGLDELDWNDEHRAVLLHGHCHQKALEGTNALEQVLALPGYTVETVDSGCCGMAGAFGYEREHYDISIKMAERRLAPAVRGASPDTIIAAPGVSCRAQIKDTTGRTALHPAEVLNAALR